MLLSKCVAVNALGQRGHRWLVAAVEFSGGGAAGE